MLSAAALMPDAAADCRCHTIAAVHARRRCRRRQTLPLPLPMLFEAGDDFSRFAAAAPCAAAPMSPALPQFMFYVC